VINICQAHTACGHISITAIDGAHHKKQVRKPTSRSSSACLYWRLQAGIIKSLLILFEQFSKSSTGDGKKTPSFLVFLLPKSDSPKTESVYV
jgi:hypothetical protein